MKAFKCKNCGYETQIDDSFYFICPSCGYEEKNEEEEGLDAIIDSVIEDILEEQKSNITNNDDRKSLVISESNPLISKNNDKCTNCGQCKKTCESIANISYDLNVCKKPVCTMCGACVLNCPNGALSFKQNYKEVKRIINLNEKIVIAIVDTSVYPYLFNMITSIENNIEEKFVGLLKRLGFDYVFNGSFGNDLNILESVTEFAERLKNKQLLPMITGSCTSFTNYAQIYHPEIIKNISTCKSPLQMQSAVIKEYFTVNKGFDKSKIITVGITTCTSENSNDSKLNMDYVLSLNEIKSLCKEEDIDPNGCELFRYDELFSEGSGSAYLRSVVGGESEAFLRTFNRVLRKRKLKENEVDITELRDIDGIKECKIQLGDYPLRIAVVEGLVNFEKLMNNNRYQKFHYIEVKNCISGCINGSGRLFNENINVDKVYKKDKNSESRSAHDNKEVHNLYKKYLGKPLSEKCLEILHHGYLDNSKALKDK